MMGYIAIHFQMLEISRMWHITAWYMLKIWRWWCAPTLKIDRAPYSHKSSISYLILPVLTARLVFCWARGCSTCDLFVSFTSIPSLSNVLHLAAGNCHWRPTCLCHDSEPLITIPDKSQLSQSLRYAVWCDVTMMHRQESEGERGFQFDNMVKLWIIVCYNYISEYTI